jgi:hypothetical protein
MARLSSVPLPNAIVRITSADHAFSAGTGLRQADFGA